jgi:hypothetical protein
MTENPVMPHAAIRYLTAFESGVLSCGVAVDKEYTKGSVDGEVIN